MNVDTIDRVVQEAHKVFGPDLEVFLSELEAFLKNPDDMRMERGATFAYRLGSLSVGASTLTFPKSDDPLVSLSFQLLALIHLKLDSYPVGSEGDFNLRSLVYPTALDRILED